MNQCEFYEECGKPGAYFCEHEGRKKDGTPAACNSHKYLKMSAESIDEEIRALEEASKVTRKIMRLEFTI